MNLVLKSATIIAPNQIEYHLQKKDIHVVDGKIKAIASTITGDKTSEILSLENLHVSIGWFDSSISFGEPGFEERETLENGLLTAAKSGFSSIVLNPTTHPSPNSGADLMFFKERSKGNAVDLFPLGNLTQHQKGEALAELYDMFSNGAVGFYDVKKGIKNANLLKIALQYAQNFDGLICSFPEDQSVAKLGVMHEGTISTQLGLKGMPSLSEELQLIRDIYLLEYTGGKLHIPFISTEKSVALIKEAKEKGLNVSCGVSLSNLFLTEEELQGFDTNYKLKPPLRTSADANALLEGVNSGVIDFVSCDHTPVDIEEKKKEFDHADFGSIGLESAFGVLNSLVGTEKAIALLTKGRERFGISTPSIAKDTKANLSLFNPEPAYTFTQEQVLSRSKNSAFYNKQLKGKVYGIINNGKLVLNT